MTKATLKPTIAKSSDSWDKLVSVKEKPEDKTKLFQTITFKLSGFNDTDRTFTAVASTSIVDRQGDSINQEGWDLDNFIANPVIPWAHDYWQPPVARAIEIGVVAGNLQFTYQAPPKGLYEFADTIWDLYRNGFMFAFSVGFIPTESEGDWQNGFNFTSCELLEISAVVVPANPQALALAYKMGTIDEKQTKQLIAKTESALTSLRKAMEEEVEEEKSIINNINITSGDLKGMVDEIIERLVEEYGLEIAKGVISSSLPIDDDKDTSWDSGKAIANIKKWATGDGDEIDFSKYKKAFLWCDPDNDDKQGGYKLPIADVSGDGLKVVWNAVKAVMSVLNGGRGGVDIPEADKKGVYGQVAKYYKKFGEDVPEFNPKSLTADERGLDNNTMSKKDETVKDVSESNSGGDVTPLPMDGKDRDKYKTVVDGLSGVATTLVAHAKALDGHAQTMSAHSTMVQQKADELSKAADYLKSVLLPTNDGDETTGDQTGNRGDQSKEDAVGKEGTDTDAVDADSDGMKTQKTAKTKDVEEEVVEEETKPEETEDAKTETGEDEKEESEEVDESKDDSAEVKSQDNPDDGAEHDDLSDETEVDPENLSDEQVEEVLRYVNAELTKDQSDSKE